MGRTPMAVVLSIILVTDTSGRVLEAQATGRYVTQTVTAYGCATLGTQKWCTPSRWSFAQDLEYPGYLELSVIFPSLCGISTGYPLPPIAAPVPSCTGEWLPVPGISNWLFSHGFGLRVNTTSGPWDFCDLSTGCNPTPSRLTRVTSIRSYWLGYDATNYYSPSSWLYTYTVTPEPATMTLLATGIAGIGGAAWRRRKRRNA